MSLDIDYTVTIGTANTFATIFTSVAIIAEICSVELFFANIAKSTRTTNIATVTISTKTAHNLVAIVASFTTATVFTVLAIVANFFAFSSTAFASHATATFSAIFAIFATVYSYGFSDTAVTFGFDAGFFLASAIGVTAF